MSQSENVSPQSKRNAMQWIALQLEGKKMSEYEIVGVLIRQFGIKTGTAWTWVQDVKNFYSQVKQ